MAGTAADRGPLRGGPHPLGAPPSVTDPLGRDRTKALVEARLLEAEVTPTRVGRFTILERVAQGGMGLLYAAYDPELDRQVALKVLRPEFSDGAVRRRIVREAQAMAKLNHPNVAQIYEVGEDRSRTFIAMEFIRGETLGRWRAAAQRGWREVVAVYAQAALGLAAAHAAGLVHRDFKPDNAMLGDDGRVRVLDFGLARAESFEPTADAEPSESRPSPSDDALRTPLTHEGSIMGTPAYMSPEQHLGEPVDASSDQFSFCVALWEALYGERPFRGATRTELAAAVTRGALSEPSAEHRVPTWVRAVVARGLEVQPARRFAGMPALLEALARDPSRRRRRVVVAALALGAVGIASAGWMFEQARRANACERVGGEIAEVWNDQRRAEVSAALLAIGPAYATSTVERVLPRLDAWAARWSGVRTDACVAAHVDGSADVESERRTSECLDERREGFAALVGAISTADDRALQEAAGSAAELVGPEACAEGAVLRRRPATTDPGVRDRVAALRRRIAEAGAAPWARRPGQLLMAAGTLVADATAIGNHPIQAEALAFAAVAHAEVGDATSAWAAGSQAALVAMRHGADDVALDAILGVAGVVPVPELRAQRAWWLSLGQMLVDRLGEADDLRGAALLEARAHATDDPAITLTHLREALAIRERILGPDHPLVGLTVSNVGATLEFFGIERADEAESHHLRGLAIRESALGPDHPLVANSLVNLAQSYLARRDFARARSLTQRALTIWENALGPKSLNVAMALGNLAGIEMYVDDHATARPLLERAIAVVEHSAGPHSPHLVVPLVNLATIHQRAGAWDTSRGLFERAVAIAEAWQGKDGTMVATALAGAAEIALLQERPLDAVVMLERALAIAERASTDPPNLAHMRYALARALWASNGDRTRAMALAAAAVRDYRSFDGDWGKDIAEIEAWIAERPTP